MNVTQVAIDHCGGKEHVVHHVRMKLLEQIDKLKMTFEELYRLITIGDSEPDPNLEVVLRDTLSREGGVTELPCPESLLINLLFVLELNVDDIVPFDVASLSTDTLDEMYTSLRSEGLGPVDYPNRPVFPKEGAVHLTCCLLVLKSICAVPDWGGAARV